MDYEDAITLLLEKRDEAYPLERVETFAQFFYWILDPNDARLRRRVGKMAVARVMRAALKSSPAASTPEPFDLDEAYHYHFPIETVLNGTAFPRGLSSVQDDLYRSWLASQPATMIARFLLQDHEHPDPIGRTPSLNRAVHFVESDGYLFYHKTELENTGRSHKILKEEWSYNHFTSPFLLALWVLLSDGVLELNQMSLWPLSNGFLQSYQEIRSSEFLAALFEYALFIRNRLDDILPPTAEVDLPDFPEWLEPAPVVFGAFDAHQDKIRLAYRA